MKKKLTIWMMLILLLFSMTSALAGGEWVVNPKTGHEELVFDWDIDTAGWWDDGELGDESIPLYVLCTLAVAAAAGAVIMHKRRVRVG